MSSRALKRSKLEELKALRESKKTRLSTYETQEEQKIYEEVDDEGYKQILRARLDEDDFVVDDNGEGYVDNGVDDWNHRNDHSDSFESESDREAGTLKGKRKRENTKPTARDQEGSINKYFNSVTQPIAKAKTVTTADDKAFMESLLGEFEDVKASQRPVSKAKLTSKAEPHRKVRVLSPPLWEGKGISANRIKEARDERSLNNSSMPSSPPAINSLDVNDDDYDFQGDVSMSDAPKNIYCSPSHGAPGRQSTALTNVKIEDEDEDENELAVKPIFGLQSDMREKGVNINAHRAIQINLKSETEEITSSSSAQTKLEVVDSSLWKDVTASLSINSATDGQFSTPASAAECLDEDGSLKFFWMDYTEVNGSLCLFGKVQVGVSKRFVSAFVKVDGLMRKLFFLPREHRIKHGQQTDDEITMDNVFEEVDQILPKHNIDNYRVKPCRRKYAFEIPDIPKECDYLKVLYPYDKPALPLDFKGESFSHVFGTNTTLFEQFVLARNIMGPCWLRIEGADFSAVKNASWCKIELQVEKPSLITVIPENEALGTPSITLMSIAIRTKVNHKDNKQEIIALAGRVYNNVDLNDPSPAEKLPSQSFTIVRPLNVNFPIGFQTEAEKGSSNIKLEKTESGLLGSFLAKMQICDPDALIGHQLDEGVYGTLLHRLKDCKTLNWHRIGRLRRSQWPNTLGRGGYFAERALVSGRLMCDLANDLGKSLMNKCQSWSLTEMCDIYLKQKRIEMDNESALKEWATTARGLLDYLGHCEADTFFIAAVALKVQMLPLGKQLTNLAGNSWARTMSGTRAERNEYILLHEFTRNKFICPDKTYDRGKGNQMKVTDENNGDDEDVAPEGKKKDKFKGGLVLEPERGLYDKFILVMDFNSLYPSIIQEYNICFTTVERQDLAEDKIPDVPEEQQLGILPKLIATLVQRRRLVKGLMKDKNATVTELAQYDIKQQALKLTANSMYGCLGYARSRFYARPLAMLTTFKGREILTSTKDLAESQELRVIYGDTDSVMINTNKDNYLDAYKIGNEFKKAVNEKYHLLEIDIDNVFQRLLLHSKKKYAALNYTSDGKTTMEVKGLDMRRREYCQLSKDMSGSILKEILSGDDTEIVVERIHEYLRNTAEKIRNGDFPSSKFIIYTKLSKDPESYPGGKSMPQVQVALRKKSKGETVKSNDVIAYVITGDANSSVNAAERAYAPQDLKADETLKPDTEWYLVKQIFPPIERLCGPIDGTDAMRIAECLGLDTRKYQIAVSSGQVDKEFQQLESTLSDEDRFQDASRLTLSCHKCKQGSTFKGLAHDAENCSPLGIKCDNSICQSTFNLATLSAQVEFAIRTATTQYYDAWLVCDDSSCGNRTRQMSVYGKRCLGAKGLASGCLGVMAYEYTDKMLYNQLLYYQSLFDVDKAKRNASHDQKEDISVLAEQNRDAFGIVHRSITQYLNKCGRQWVQMDSIFSFTPQ